MFLLLEAIFIDLLVWAPEKSGFLFYLGHMSTFHTSGQIFSIGRRPLEPGSPSAHVPARGGVGSCLPVR